MKRAGVRPALGCCTLESVRGSLSSWPPPTMTPGLSAHPLPRDTSGFPKAPVVEMVRGCRCCCVGGGVSLARAPWRGPRRATALPFPLPVVLGACRRAQCSLLAGPKGVAPEPRMGPTLTASWAGPRGEGKSIFPSWRFGLEGRLPISLDSSSSCRGLCEGSLVAVPGSELQNVALGRA